jgi:hypothetical protein
MCRTADSRNHAGAHSGRGIRVHSSSEVDYVRGLYEGKLLKVSGTARSMTPPEAEQVESVLQTWLNDNPNASIEHVTQTPVSDAHTNAGITTFLLVTIFYRD